jgi:hypothetical protein
MGIFKKHMSNGQRSGMILQSVVGNRLPVPTNEQVRKFRRLTPAQVYADDCFPRRRTYA